MIEGEFRVEDPHTGSLGYIQIADDFVIGYSAGIDGEWMIDRRINWVRNICRKKGWRVIDPVEEQLEEGELPDEQIWSTSQPDPQS